MERFISILVIGFTVRLFLAYFCASTIDMQSFQTDVEILRRGGNIYAEFPYYNYSPFWSYWLLACSYIAGWLHLSFPFIVRASLSFVDMTNGYLIYKISNNNQFAFAAFILNPVIILITAFHGMFETLAMLPILAAVLIVPRHRGFSVLLLGTASLIALHITLFLVITLFVYAASKPRRVVIMTLSALAFFLATFLPFRSAGNQILQNVFFHAGASGFYGLTQWIAKPPVYALFLLVMVSLPLLSRFWIKLSLIQALFLSALGFLVFAPGFFGQFTFLALALGALLVSPTYLLFTGACFLYSLSYYFQIGIPLPVNNLVWETSALAALWISRINHHGSFHNSTMV